MIFIVEQYLSNRNRKLKAWRREGENWVKARRASTNYPEIYKFRDWERENPRPVRNLKPLVGALVPIFFIALMISFFTWLIFFNDSPDTGKDGKPVAAQEEKAYEPKEKDIVRVRYGEFKLSEGEVVKINPEGGAIIKLTKSTLTKEFAKAAGYNYPDQKGKEVGELLDVNSNDNLTFVKKAEQ